jgi:hypothetical protein
MEALQQQDASGAADFGLPDELRRREEHDTACRTDEEYDDGLGGSSGGFGGGGDRYELWCVRILADGLSPEDLDNAAFNLPLNGIGEEDSAMMMTTRTTTSSTIDTRSGMKFAIQLLPSPVAPPQGNDSMQRLLYPISQTTRRRSSAAGSVSSESSRDDEDDADKGKGDAHDGSGDGDAIDFGYVPTTQPFTRHCNIVSYFATGGELSSSSSPARPPGASASYSELGAALVRRSYEPVPQKSGLKRRWVPIGGSYQRQQQQTTTMMMKKQRPPSPQLLATIDRNNSSIRDVTAHLDGEELLTTRGQQAAGEATSANHPSSAAAGGAPPAAEKADKKADKKAAKKEAKKAAKKEAKKAAKKEARRERKRGKP